MTMQKDPPRPGSKTVLRRARFPAAVNLAFAQWCPNQLEEGFVAAIEGQARADATNQYSWTDDDGIGEAKRRAPLLTGSGQGRHTMSPKRFCKSSSKTAVCVFHIHRPVLGIGHRILASRATSLHDLPLGQ